MNLVKTVKRNPTTFFPVNVTNRVVLKEKVRRNFAKCPGCYKVEKRKKKSTKRNNAISRNS